MKGRPEGDGFCAYFILESLREMMNRMAVDLCSAIGRDEIEDVRPCQIFDLIGGSGNGGIIAILIGRLGLTVQEAYESYVELSHQIFEEGLSREALSKRFETAAKKLVAKLTGSEDTKMSCPGRSVGCKTFVLATSLDSMDRDNVQYFRTYRSRNNQGPNCAIWEAMRATTADQRLYLEFGITESYGIRMRYCGMDTFGNNDPTKRMLEETKLQFKGQELLSVISIGSSHPGIIEFPKNTESTSAIFQAVAEDFEEDAEEMKSVQRYNLYSLQDLTLDEYAFSKVIASTRSYFQDPAASKRLDKTVEVLLGTASQSIQRELELQELM
ncbi:hypothetical protein DL96DRAFT_1554750 [Flagelloscypha sp. PMI_526]|nr:hypothetical protein DL96DRAFT_1554750 [Flagelloscypha sp. PMI_526]